MNKKIVRTILTIVFCFSLFIGSIGVVASESRIPAPGPDGRSHWVEHNLQNVRAVATITQTGASNLSISVRLFRNGTLVAQSSATGNTSVTARTTWHSRGAFNWTSSF